MRENNLRGIAVLCQARIHRRSTVADVTVAMVLMILSGVAGTALAQSTGTLQGQVFDATGSVLRGATVNVYNTSIGFDRTVVADGDGRYHVTAIPAGTYQVTTSASGFKSAVIRALQFEVGRIVVRDF